MLVRSLVVVSSVEPPADVEHERPVVERPAGGDPAQGQLGLLVARDEPCREAVAPLDLAEEGLAVIGVTDGAGPDREHALGAEPLRLAAVVGKHVADTRDRERQQLAAFVDAFAEPCDHALACDFLDAPAVNVSDQQTGRVGAQVDGCDAHRRRLATRYNAARAAGWSSQVARRAHNPEVAGSNPAPATEKGPGNGAFSYRRTASGIRGAPGGPLPRRK